MRDAELLQPAQLRSRPRPGSKWALLVLRGSAGLPRSLASVPECEARWAARRSAEGLPDCHCRRWQGSFHDGLEVQLAIKPQQKHTNCAPSTAKIGLLHLLATKAPRRPAWTSTPQQPQWPVLHVTRPSLPSRHLSFPRVGRGRILALYMQHLQVCILRRSGCG